VDEEEEKMWRRRRRTDTMYRIHTSFVMLHALTNKACGWHVS